MHTPLTISPALLTTSPASGGLSSSAGDLFARIWPTLLVLLVVAVVGGLFAMWLRRRLSAKDEGGAGGFTLEDLRQLHRAGGMSDEEFAKAKEAMLSKRPSRAAMADKLVPKRGRGPRQSGGAPPDERDNPPSQQRKR